MSHVCPIFFLLYPWLLLVHANSLFLCSIFPLFVASECLWDSIISFWVDLCLSSALMLSPERFLWNFIKLWRRIINKLLPLWWMNWLDSMKNGIRYWDRQFSFSWCIIQQRNKIYVQIKLTAIKKGFLLHLWFVHAK